jgi:hypothetical protein
MVTSFVTRVSLSKRMTEVRETERRRVVEVAVANSALLSCDLLGMLSELMTGDHRTLRSPPVTMSRGFPLVRMVVYSTGSKGHSSIKCTSYPSHIPV